MADNNYGGFGPRVGLAYSLDSKTVIRSSFSRAFGYVTCAAGSAHFLGFVTIFTPGKYHLWVYNRRFFCKDGFPPYPLPPQLDPSFGNGNSVSWWQGKDATLLPTADSWTLSIQRQLTGHDNGRGGLLRHAWYTSAEWAQQLQPGPVHFSSAIRR